MSADTNDNNSPSQNTVNAPVNESGNGGNNDAVPVAQRLQSIRERIARKLARPQLSPPHPDLPSLEAMKNFPTAASNLADAIGTVNPRPPGLVNEMLQVGKRFLARLLGWLVRPQRDFNRALVDSMARMSEVLETANQVTSRDLVLLAESLARSGDIHRATAEELDSLGGGIDRLREELAHHVAALSAHFDEKMKLQKWAYDGALARQSTALQDRTYELLGELQGKLSEEIRLLRQRMAAQARVETIPLAASSVAGASPAASSAPPGIDYFQLERHFRGTEEEIRARQSFYVPFFQDRHNVLDIACGRGEFLELMREAKVNARGVDLDADMAGRCLEKALNVTRADVFAYLESVPDGTLDGIFCAQFVEHLTPDAYVRLLAECGRTLAPGGVLAVETQNPECLAIFSQSFFLDPTHAKPVPPGLLRVLFQEAGLERISTHFLSPASAALPLIPQLATQAIEPETLQAWNSAVARFNQTFFGGMDYAVIAYRAGSPGAGASASS
jgi:SAM-dependent methyltransferase